MTLSEKMKQIPFFQTRTIIDSSDRETIGLVGFKENEDDVYSSIVASPASTSGIIPDMVMISSNGCLVRLDAGEQTILISMSKEEDKDGFSETFPASIDDGEFFQSTLINDYRHINFEHIEALRQVMELINDTRKESIQCIDSPPA